MRAASRRRTVQLFDEDGHEWGLPTSPGADVTALADMIGDIVGAALSRLPAAQREVLALRLRRLPVDRAEIAACLGVPRPTVSTRLFNARESMRHLVVELRRGDGGGA